MANVILLAHTPAPEHTVASAAKLCYSSSSITGLRDNLTDEKAASFVEMLSEIGHESPIEHASFTFGIEGVSRSLLAQITRHRMASFSVKSQRYVREGCFEYITPPEIEADAEAKKVYEELMIKDQECYDRISAILKEKHIKTFLAQGKDEKTAARLAEKKAIEDARFVLPNSCSTQMVMTMNARSLHNFFRHRCCNRAQWEIQDIANQMLKLVSEVAPNLFKNAGPSCLTGPCPEGKMTCGKIKEVRAYYEELKKNG
ncbi:MAG: FAD-dependent thymidylate synthase [Clostridia bacterium]|nr:FAD-dependent thymidylate synthase [Clostridia bacterium]